MHKRKIRIGIDVGGTFTKSVAIDNDTCELLGSCITPTTHFASEGVAKGVVEVFHRMLASLGRENVEVVFLAHSTTQATNALLEGDVAPVGVIGMGSGLEGLRAKGQTNIGAIELAPGRVLKVSHRYVDTGQGADEPKVEGAIKELMAEGATVIVSSEAFGVDDPRNEQLVMSIASRMGLGATGANEISKLYGLKVRTRTAVVNASILPKMMETANLTENSVRASGISAPVMIMRGDGGVMDVNEMRKRPILTMLSGPAASVAGALMYLKVSDGIFFEVGGTSTNIGVIRHGRPMVKYVELGGHATFLHSLDVRVLGVAGGSMPRVSGNKLVDVGPRSAHIAGLPYACFAKPEEFVEPKLVTFRPRGGDPEDYVAIEVNGGKRFAITNTCASNALGLAVPGHYAYGNPESARAAISALAEHLGTSVEKAAEAILDAASAKIIKVLQQLIEEYKLDRQTVMLVGGGGGAAALIPFTSAKINLPYKISDHAEVISSIGDGLAMVRDVVERTIVDPTPEDIISIRKEAEEAVISAGATPGSVQVYIEIDAQKHRVRATALGATELQTKDVAKKDATEEERRSLAAQSMRVPPEEAKTLTNTGYFSVIAAQIKPKGFTAFLKKPSTSVRVVDRSGVIRLSVSNGLINSFGPDRLVDELAADLDRHSKITEAGRTIPGAFVLMGPRIVDLSGLNSAEQVISMAQVELDGSWAKDKEIVAVYQLP